MREPSRASELCERVEDPLAAHTNALPLGLPFDAEPPEMGRIGPQPAARASTSVTASRKRTFRLSLLRLPSALDALTAAIMLASTSRMSLHAPARRALRTPVRFASTGSTPPAPPPPPTGSSTTRGWFRRSPKPADFQPIYRRHPILFASVAVPTVIVASLGVALLALLGYDASTYHEKHLDKVAVSPLALMPERGGKKGLKVAKVLVDDEDQGKDVSAGKQRLVVVGGGWGVSWIRIACRYWYSH